MRIIKMSTENRFYDFVEGGLENTGSFTDMRNKIFGDLSKKKYFESQSKASERTKEMVKEITSDIEGILARDQLSEAFIQINSYEHDFRDFNKEVKKHARKEEDPITYSLEMLDRTWEEQFYIEKLKRAKKLGADISEFPNELNYMARLN